MSYVNEVYDRVVAKNPSEPEFHQAVKEVLESLAPVINANEEAFRKSALLERLTEPERIISSAPWVDDKGQTQVNKGFRVQFSSASDLTRVVCVSIPPSIRGFLNSSDSNKFSKTV